MASTASFHRPVFILSSSPASRNFTMRSHPAPDHLCTTCDRNLRHRAMTRPARIAGRWPCSAGHWRAGQWRAYTWVVAFSIGFFVLGSARLTPHPHHGITIALPAAHAATDNSKLYTAKLFRLAELLGTLHYLRAICGADDGQKWRQAVSDLINSENSDAVRRATIARRFNRGYRGYSRTYRNCTPSARITIRRFFAEAITLSDELLQSPK